MSSTESKVKLLTAGNVLAGILASTALSLFLTWLRAPRYPREIPWVGTGKGWLAAFRDMMAWIQDGYDTCSKKGRAFIVPGLLGTPPEVIIPPSQMGWMLDQPDHVLSTAEAHYDILNGDYSFVDRQLLRHPYHEHVVHRTLARHLTALTPDIDDQVRLCVDDIYGTDEAEWKTVNIWDSMMQLIPRVTNMVFVGKPLCDNPEYIDGMTGFATSVSRDLLIFPMIPTILKPIICPVIGLWSKLQYRKTARHSLPVVRKRLADIAAKERGDVAYEDWTPPNEYLTWHINTARAEGRADELEPGRIAQRLLPLNFAAIHTTVITASNALLDMLEHDAGQDIVESLREEASQVRQGSQQQQPDGRWTKAGLARLHRLDSAIRESMRVSAFSQTMPIRKVIARDGVSNPATGQHFSRGTMLSCPMWAIQHDGDIYGPGADRYDAFRFSREREAYEARGEHGRKSPGEGLRVANMGTVTTSQEHLAFGHGRHACPGRFFVAQELKILFTYLLANYDIKAPEERPKASWVGKTIVPPMSATIHLRRKRDTSVKSQAG